MPRRPPQEQLDRILRELLRFPDGASAEEIGQTLEFELPHRTLQRRLALLVDRGQAIPLGHGRARRYRLADVSSEAGATQQAVGIAPEGERYVPISAEGETVRRAVRRPVQIRIPVG